MLGIGIHTQWWHGNPVYDSCRNPVHYNCCSVLRSRLFAIHLEFRCTLVSTFLLALSAIFVVLCSVMKCCIYYITKKEWKVVGSNSNPCQFIPQLSRCMQTSQLKQYSVCFCVHFAQLISANILFYADVVWTAETVCIACVPCSCRALSTSLAGRLVLVEHTLYFNEMIRVPKQTYC